jgi:hypothetical protein
VTQVYGKLPLTGGIFNPLRTLYMLIALVVFGGDWLGRKVRKQRTTQSE